MQLLRTISAGFCLLSTLSLTVATKTEVSLCDSYCARRLFYQTAYSSAATAVRATMTAYESGDWCVTDAGDWCPELINSTLSSIAGTVANIIGVDFDHCDDACLLSTLSTVSCQAAYAAMVWSEKTVSLWNSTQWDLPWDQRNTSVQALHWTMYTLSNCTTPVIDNQTLADAMNNGTAIVPAPSHDPQDQIPRDHATNDHDTPFHDYHDHSMHDQHAPAHDSHGHDSHGHDSHHHDHHDDHDDDHHKALAIALPFLFAPLPILGGLGGLFAKAFRPDTILSQGKLSQHLVRLAEATTKVLDGSNWLRFMCDTGLLRLPYDPLHFPEWANHLYWKKGVRGKFLGLPDWSPPPSSVWTGSDPSIDELPPLDPADPAPGNGDAGPSGGDSPGEGGGSVPGGDEARPGEDPSSHGEERPSPGDDSPPHDDMLPPGEERPLLRGHQLPWDPAKPVQGPISPPEAPPAPGEAPIPGGPIDPTKFFRAERFNPETGILEQQTLLRAAPRQVLNAKRGYQLIRSGLKPFFPLDAEGAIMKTVPDGTTNRVVYHRMFEVEQMDGEWRKIGERFVQYKDGLPALSSQGEPLVKSDSGIMNTLQPIPSEGKAVSFGENVAFRLLDAEGNVVPESDGTEARVDYDPSRKRLVESDEPYKLQPKERVDRPTATPGAPTHAPPTQDAPTHVSATQASPTHASPTHASPSHPSPSHGSSARGSSAQTSPSNASPTRTSPTHASPSHASSSKPSSAHAPLSHASPAIVSASTASGSGDSSPAPTEPMPTRFRTATSTLKAPRPGSTRVSSHTKVSEEPRSLTPRSTLTSLPATTFATSSLRTSSILPSSSSTKPPRFKLSPWPKLGLALTQSSTTKPPRFTLSPWPKFAPASTQSSSAKRLPLSWMTIVPTSTRTSSTKPDLTLPPWPKFMLASTRSSSTKPLLTLAPWPKTVPALIQPTSTRPTLTLPMWWPKSVPTSTQSSFTQLPPLPPWTLPVPTLPDYVPVSIVTSTYTTTFATPHFVLKPTATPTDDDTRSPWDPRNYDPRSDPYADIPEKCKDSWKLKHPGRKEPKNCAEKVNEAYNTWTNYKLERLGMGRVPCSEYDPRTIEGDCPRSAKERAKCILGWPRFGLQCF